MIIQARLENSQLARCGKTAIGLEKEAVEWAMC